MTMNGSWNALIEDIRERLAEAERELEEERRILAMKQADVTRYKGMLRAAGELEPTPQKAKAKKSQPRTREETMEKIKHGIIVLAQGEPAIPGVAGSFTAIALAQATGVDYTTTRKALAQLRDEGQIRVAGLAPANGGRQSNAFVSVSG